jgi:hypothetical protein
MTETATSPRVWPDRDGWLDLLDRYGATATGGLVAGFVVGGVGGRLAMFVLRLTSSDGVIGIQSDDDFTIGQFSTDTIFLLLVTTLLGTLFAFGYLVVRRWLPAANRPALSAVFFALLGGSLVIEPDGVDFTLLSPEWLAVLLFILLPGAYGWVMAAIIEHLISHPGKARKARVAAIVLFAAVGAFGLFPAFAAVVGLVLVLIGRRWPALADLVEGRVVTWAVRALLIAVAVVFAVSLTKDVTEVL